MRIIFLDVDGVLNSNRTFMAWGAGSMRGRGKHTVESTLLDPVSVSLLRTLVETVEAKIVISSSWRIGCEVSEFHDVFDLYGWDTRSIIIGKTPRLYDIGSRRGDEIAAWIATSGQDTQDYIIFDDDSDMLPEQKAGGHFIKTPLDYGLGMPETEAALKHFGFDVGAFLQVRRR